MTGIETRIKELHASKEPSDNAMARLLETGILDCLMVFKRQEIVGKDISHHQIENAIGAIISIFIADLLQHSVGMPLTQKFEYAAFVRQTLIDHFDRVFLDIVKSDLRK